MNHNRKIYQSGTILGLIGPLIMAIGMLSAAFGYSGVAGQPYNPLNHFVSELGELAVSDLSWAFNGGLIIGGLLTAGFMVILALQLDSWLKYPMSVLGVVTALAATAVGIFPMDHLGPHITAAMAFFNLGMFLSFAYSIIILFTRKHNFPKWLAIPGFINALLFLGFLNLPGGEEMSEEGVDALEAFHEMMTNRPDVLPLAVMEWAVVLGILLWLLMLGGYLVWQQRIAKNV